MHFIVRSFKALQVSVQGGQQGSFPSKAKNVLSSTRLGPIQRVPETFSLGVQWPEPEAVHLPPTSNYTEFHENRLSPTVLISVRVLLCGCETWSLTLREENRYRCLRTGLSGEYLDLKWRKWRAVGEDCIMRSFVTCTLHQILLR